MSNLQTRILSALVFGVLVIGGIYVSEVSFFLLFTFVAVISCYELIQMLDPQENKFSWSVISRVLSANLPLFILLPKILGFNEAHMSIENMVSFIIAMFFIQLPLSLYSAPKSPLKYISPVLISKIYISLPIFCLALMSVKYGSYEPEIPMALLLLIWVNDSAAYFVGSKLGKRKLSPTISPKKTWEGFFGGLFFTMLTAGIISYVSDFWHLKSVLILGALVASFGTMGDLIESMFKRFAKVKDSGQIMPGHGGLLDRFDGFFFMIPIVYFYLNLLEKYI